MYFIDIFLCATAAWFIACLFTALPFRDAITNGALAGICCTLPALFLSLADIQMDLSLALFLLLAFVLPGLQTQHLEKRLMALLPALGGYALLALLSKQAAALLPTLGAFSLIVLAAAVFAVIAYVMRGQFPPDDWREYFMDGGQEGINVRRQHIWLTLSLMAGLEIGLLYTASLPDSVASAVFFSGTATVLFWGTLCAVCLLVYYRREKLTTLVEQSYHNEMQSFMSVIRSQRHDYNFHLHTLSGLIDTGGLDQCRQYLHHLVHDSSSINTFLPVADPAIAALIFSFRTMALEDGIELHLDIQNDLKNVVTNVYETNKIIGNLLQNAIDEVRTHKDKTFGINLYIIKRGEDCIIHTANKIELNDDAQRHLQEMFLPGFSTKANHEGIGLSSIRVLLQRYRGTLYSRIDGDIIHCFARIPLRMKGGQT